MSTRQTKAELQAELNEARKKKETVISNCTFYGGASDDNGEMMLVLARAIEANAHAVSNIMAAAGGGTTLNIEGDTHNHYGDSKEE